MSTREKLMLYLQQEFNVIATHVDYLPKFQAQLDEIQRIVLEEKMEYIRELEYEIEQLKAERSDMIREIYKYQP